MSYQAIPNLIAHEIQVTEGIHLSHISRHHIERLVMESVQDENEELMKNKDYWQRDAMHWRKMYANLHKGLEGWTVE